VIPGKRWFDGVPRKRLAFTEYAGDFVRLEFWMGGGAAEKIRVGGLVIVDNDQQPLGILTHGLGA
jgi:hypothetical protein